ncbi:hypothetical protein DDZ13_02955 [Coraliomargarita sinensis]|uniref:PEP-CTERM protein-sorting domain-containing protein n=1 Tax=Coraliomargarita sinensis TaxID=2174842 RepID=A0A317ZHK3_9BACT|nr:hypothetical protein [Coraliomargarita sinensis]PXA04940.1 hypothetical protein DDZ13_02955 [Coraliomargarita sinensis]
MTQFKTITFFAACLAVTTAANASMQLTFGAPGGVSSQDGSVTSLTDNSPEASSDPPNALSASGFLTGVNNTDTISFTATAFSDSSLVGNDLTTSTSDSTDLARNGDDGWGARDGGGAESNIESDDGFFDAVLLAFDLSGLSGNTGLRITDVLGVDTGGSGSPSMQVIVDGVSTTTVGGLIGSGLSIDLTDGDTLAFREDSGTGNYRIRSITFDTYAIPEPSTFGLLAGCFGLTWVMLRRRT